MSAEEQDEKRTDDIVNLMDDKYKKSSFFDELWAKKNPEEAK